MSVEGTKKVIKATARRFQEAVETAAEALEELVDFADQDIFDDLAEEFVDDASDSEKGGVRRAWLENVAAFALLYSLKIDMAEEEAFEEEGEED